MSHLKKPTLLSLSVFVLVLVALFLRTGLAQATSLQHSGTWRVVSSPNPSMNNNRFNGIAAISASNIWAVGEESGPFVPGPFALIERWDGTAWHFVSSPFFGPSTLKAVTALSTNNAWAIGSVNEYGSNAEHTYILHWDGTAWERSFSPNPGASFNTLNAVTALSANSIWAVGEYGTGSAPQTLIEHWNGATWSVVSSPSPGSAYNHLNAVTARSANNIWAVGEYSNTGGFAAQTLVEHWNGTAWSVVSSPSPGSLNSQLNAVVAISAHNIWALGSSLNTNYIGQTLIEHWDGTTWKVVPSPNIGSSGLSGVVALSAHNILAVGDSSSNGTTRTLTLHWDGTTWNIVSSPNAGSNSNFLSAIARVPGSQKLWTVGGYFDSGSISRTLSERWNGTAWSIVSSPNIDDSSPSLKGVAAISAHDAWTVGDYSFGSGGAQTLIEHWNGAAWSIVSNPNPGSVDDHMNGVVAISSSNIWAVGDASNDTYNYQTLIEHWDGATWSAISSPNVAVIGSNTLNAVAALSANNLWTVGAYTSSNGLTQTLIEHWDGTSWSILSSPNVAAGNNTLTSVTTISPNNVWAVGYTRSNRMNRTLIEHWDGTSWSIVPTPNAGTGDNSLNGVTGISSDNAWTVGYATSNGTRQVLIEHWDGTSWSIVPAPNVGTGDNSLNGVLGTSSHNIWAVGNFYDSSKSSFQTLIEHWNGTHWSVVVSPNAGLGDNHLLGVARIPGTERAWAVGDYFESGFRTLTERYF
jgi:hypothetical protein